MRKPSARSLLVLGIFTLFMAAAVQLQAAYIITSLDYQISPSSTVGKIGDNVLFQMAVIDATATYSGVSQVVNVTNTSIEVACADFLTLAPSPANPLYIYDGVRTWVITTGYTNAAIKSVTLSNDLGVLIAGSTVSNYLSLQYATFYGAQGVAAGGAPNGSAKVDIGTAIYGINLYDDGDGATHNDAAPGDGVYNAKFDVREAYQFNVKNGSIVGHFTNVNTAGNDPYISPKKISLDTVRPRVELVNASPNPYNPNKELAQIFYYLTENSSVQLDVKFYDSSLNVTNTIKTLTAAGYFGYNQPILWDGLSESGVIQADGDYIYQFSITDAAGNTGAVFTGTLKVTTVEVLTSLYSIDSEYSQLPNPQTVVTAKMNIELRHATLANLRNLGFDYPVGSYNAADYRNYPWIYIDLRVYDIGGSQITAFPKDSYTLTDSDPNYINIDSITYSRQFQTYTFPPTGFNFVQFPTGNPCAVTNTTVYTIGNADGGDDWDNCFMFPLNDQGGGVFKSNPTYIYYSASMAPGTYIISFKGILVGKDIITTSGVLEGSVDCMSGSVAAQVQYFYTANHAIPSYFFDTSSGVMGDERGYGISSQIRTVSFRVEQNPTIPVPDSTPPNVVPLSEYPSNGVKLLPGVIGPGNAVYVTLTDDGVGAGPVNLSTLVLRDPFGNQVPGTVAWNAGSPGTKNWDVYYVPDKSLTLGGIYKFTIVPVDAAYNIGNAKEYSFEIIDTSMPNISNVTVIDFSSTSSEILTLSTSKQVDFPVASVECTLLSGGTAAVNYENSSITVQIDDGTGNTVSGKVNHEASTNVLSFVPDSQLMDGKYIVQIVAESVNGYAGTASYKFYITTKDAVCIDLYGVTGTVATDQTYLRMTPRMAGTTGIVDGSNITEVQPLDFSVSTLNVTTSNGYNQIFSRPIRVSVTGHTAYPITFNPSICPATIRLHYTDSDVSGILNALGMDETDLRVWVLNGNVWTQVSGISSPVVSSVSTDRYIEFPITSISSSNNVYALMYLANITSPVVYNFQNTKVFNPVSGGPARFFYTQNIASIGALGGNGNVRVGIFTTAGSMVRMLEYQDAVDNASVFNTISNYDVDPSNAGSRYYYFTWDGKNDNGSYVRNGIYVVKIELTTTGGAKSTLSRTIAVIK